MVFNGEEVAEQGLSASPMEVRVSGEGTITFGFNNLIFKVTRKSGGTKEFPIGTMTVRGFSDAPEQARGMNLDKVPALIAKLREAYELVMTTHLSGDTGDFADVAVMATGGLVHRDG